MKSVLVAWSIAALAPTAAQGTVVIASPPSIAAVDGFSLAALIDGTDHVLTSVDDRSAPSSDPFGTGTAAFVFADVAAKPAGATARGKGVYGQTDAAAQEPLPEPTTWLMMILGFFGLSFAVRRRSSSTGDRVRFS